MQPQSFGKVVPTPNLSTWLKDSFALIAQPEPQRTNSNNCYPLKSHIELCLKKKKRKRGGSSKQRKKMGFKEINSKAHESFTLFLDATDGSLYPVVQLRH